MPGAWGHAGECSQQCDLWECFLVFAWEPGPHSISLTLEVRKAGDGTAKVSHGGALRLHDPQ